MTTTFYLRKITQKISYRKTIFRKNNTKIILNSKETTVV